MQRDGRRSREASWKKRKRKEGKRSVVSGFHPRAGIDASDGLAGPWAFAGYLANFSQQVAGGSGEATPVWPAGAVPGDEAPPPEYFLTFAGDPLALVLMRAEWEWDSRDRPHPA